MAIQDALNRGHYDEIRLPGLKLATFIAPGRSKSVAGTIDDGRVTAYAHRHSRTGRRRHGCSFIKAAAAQA
jgi:hypothetical protein